MPGTFEQRRFIVRGRVQGVNFRAYVAERARELGVRGWIRNCPDGATVEAVAQGTDEQLRTFADQAMRRGPPGARVDDFEEVPETPGEALERFGIRG